MRLLTVLNNVTLDGVMQAPGRLDEDERDGFQHGGWATPYDDADKGRIMAQGMATESDLLFGRRTYEDFFKVWPGRTDNPFTEVLDRLRKFVVSTTLSGPLPWYNSTLLGADGAESVAKLKASAGNDLITLGSGELVRSLIRRNLVDRYVLLIHPLVLGSGRRLFADDGTFMKLRVVDSVPTSSGVIISTYRPEA